MNREQIYDLIEGQVYSDKEIQALLNANNITPKEFIEHNVDLKIKRMGIKSSFLSEYFSVTRLEKEIKGLAKKIKIKLKAKK